MQEVNSYRQLRYISVSKSDHGHDCDDDGGDGGGHVRGISYYTLGQNVIKLHIYWSFTANNGDGDDGDGDNDIGDDERQEVSVTHCWLSLALCLTWDAFKIDSTYTCHLARTQLGSFSPQLQSCDRLHTCVKSWIRSTYIHMLKVYIHTCVKSWIGSFLE